MEDFKGNKSVQIHIISKREISEMLSLVGNSLEEVCWMQGGLFWGKWTFWNTRLSKKLLISVSINTVSVIFNTPHILIGVLGDSEDI